MMPNKISSYLKASSTRLHTIVYIFFVIVVLFALHTVQSNTIKKIERADSQVASAIYKGQINECNRANAILISSIKQQKEFGITLNYDSFIVNCNKVIDKPTTVEDINKGRYIP